MRRLAHRHRRAVLGLLLACVSASGLAAQDWDTRQQDGLWVGAFVDQPLTQRLALWFDGSWRTLDHGREPSQLLLRPGLQLTLRPGVRVAGGYAFIASEPAGRLPIAQPTQEHRSWQQLSLSADHGPVQVSHRFRVEQRWITPQRDGADGDDPAGPTSYRNRVRYMARAQTALGGLRLRERPVTGWVWDEVLLPVGGNTALLSVGQNRLAAGVGIPLSATLRAELGYLNLYTPFTAQRANEVTHTLWLSWHWTGAAPR